MTDNNKINEPADLLDGARVITWAWSGDKPFGLLHHQDDEYEPIEIFGLAICQYDDSSAIYRFSCDKDWEVQQDDLYDSIEEAIAQLPDQYKSVIPTWTNKRARE